MTEWSQPALPLIDPTEPRVLPQDPRAWFTLNWLSPSGQLNRQKAFEADELETVLRLTAGQPNLYMSQCFLDRPVRRHLFVRFATHAYADLDVYRVPELAGLPRDKVVRRIRKHCDSEGVPQPSVIIGSGRGYYCKWYWSTPIGSDGVGSVVSVNRALVRRLARFDADPKATDATRVLRVTGTEHTGAHRMVELLHLEQRGGRVITYDADCFAREIAPSASEEPDRGTALPAVADVDRATRRSSAPHHFSREGWHWAIIEDCYTLARLRWSGSVPEGWRDTFGFVIACQLARIVRPEALFGEVITAVSLILPLGYVRRDLRSHCSTLLRRARTAYDSGQWSLLYHYRKDTLFNLLQVTPAEERHMRALISDHEKARRHAQRERARRAEAGSVSRATWLAAMEDRRTWARILRSEGRPYAEIARIMALSSDEAARKLANRAA